VTVYLVWATGTLYDAPELEGVFSTSERAETYVARRKAQSKRWPVWEGHVEKSEVDSVGVP